MDRPEVSLSHSTVDAAVHHLFTSGCVMLREFAQPARIASLRRDVEALYREDITHIYERDFRARGLPAFSEYLFEEKHRALLDAIFSAFEYEVFGPGTHARRIAAPGGRMRWHDPWGGERWQNPLGYHIDAI